MGMMNGGGYNGLAGDSLYGKVGRFSVSSLASSSNKRSALGHRLSTEVDSDELVVDVENLNL